VPPPLSFYVIGVGLGRRQDRRLRMSKLVEKVRNSPLMKRRGGGGYSVLETENKDPFVKGINFKIYYYASAEGKHTTNSPEVQKVVGDVCQEAEAKSRPLRKVLVTVKATHVMVQDEATKLVDYYPIFRIAYCGGHSVYGNTFFFIHKTKVDKALRVEIFKCDSTNKVRAITLAAAKAFNIAYKAYSLDMAKKERKSGESPLVQRRMQGDKPPVSKLTARVAPGVVTGGTHTPQAPRKVAEDSGLGMRARSGSSGTDPAVKPLITLVHNEATGSTHNVAIPQDFDKEFQELAESRVQPGVLRTSFSADETDGFNIDSILDQVDEVTEDN